ncbi:hypothetical protein BGZ98_002546 [Dissophora globulifera]|nr:hypothetical protein BGZ98_002546 [Dissophora globulifera]
MADNIESSTLPFESEINDLPEEDNAKEYADTALVSLVSLVTSFKSILLRRNKTILGRNSAKCSEGGVLQGTTISSTHCEITSRSLVDASAVIWIKDISSNGVWVNAKRIAKDEPTKIFSTDIISFAPGPVDDNGDSPAFLLVDKRKKAEDSNQVKEHAKRPIDATENNKDDEDKVDEEPGKKKTKLDEDAAFEKEFNCGICHEIMHKAHVLQPCLHAFCKGSTECPTCRQVVTRTKRDFKLNNLIEAFLESRPHMKRDDLGEDDGADSDSSDVVHTRRNLGLGRHGGGDTDGEDEHEDDESEDDDDDGQNMPLPLNFHRHPDACPCCDPSNTLGYVCPAGVRLQSLGPNPSVWQYTRRRVRQPGHLQCQDCRNHLPDIPHGQPERVMDLFKCKMCGIPSCGCQTRSVEDRIAQNAILDGILNYAETSIINDYLTAKALTTGSVWQEIKDGMDNGDYSYLRMPGQPALQGQGVTSSHKLCRRCETKFHANGPLYQWRKAIDPAQLPANVTARQDCWWGRECRTQFNVANPSHAERLNHICERRRGNS